MNAPDRTLQNVTGTRFLFGRSFCGRQLLDAAENVCYGGLVPRATVRISLRVNGVEHGVAASPDMPLLWVLRDLLGLTGTKYSCGIGLCGACVVHLDGEPICSCTTPVSSVGRRRITTIEGLSAGRDHPLQLAWIAEETSQCGYCQPGILMSAAALLAKTPHPTGLEIDRALEGHICRCGTYLRIRRAIRRAADSPAPSGGK